MRNLALAVLAAATAASAASPVAAATVTGDLTVKLNITTSCTVTPPSAGLDFGSTGVITANIDKTADLSVTCTNTLPYSVSLGAGAGTGATLTVRKMTGPGGATVNYGLYRDAARAQNWGTAGGETVAGVGNGSAQAITVYGRVPTGQPTPAAGAYSDTVVVTVTY